jgi:hypothetical protein
MRPRAARRGERNKNILFRFNLFNLLIRLERPSRANYLTECGGESANGVSRMAPRPNWKGYLKLSLVSCASPTSPKRASCSANLPVGNRP